MDESYDSPTRQDPPYMRASSKKNLQPSYDMYYDSGGGGGYEEPMVNHHMPNNAEQVVSWYSFFIICKPNWL